MLNFLKTSRKLLSVREPLCIVIGNESCDLDSAVCALALSYYYQQEPPAEVNQTCNFLPILNIKRKDFALKTEVRYLLEKANIDANVLSFRDELQPEQLARSVFALVDHHISPFSAQSVLVYDHRPWDASASSALPVNCRITVEQVGSCATLIAELLLSSNCAEKYLDALDLLHKTIIMDTVNFSAAAGRCTEKDKSIAAQIEQLLGLQEDVQAMRKCYFQELCEAREDVSQLSALQLLYKDMKLIGNANTKVALPGFPISVCDFLRRPDAQQALQQLASELDCSVLLLLGMVVQKPSGLVQREIGLVNINNKCLFDAILLKLQQAEAPSLQLEEIQNVQGADLANGKYFRQNNVKATRKHILPMVKQTLDAIERK